MSHTLATKQVFTGAFAQSDNLCRACNGTGRVDRMTCADCYDPAAARREEDASMARHRAAIEECDRLMGEWRKDEEDET